jgi:hypothetical protein
MERLAPQAPQHCQNSLLKPKNYRKVPGCRGIDPPELDSSRRNVSGNGHVYGSAEEEMAWPTI